DTTSKSATPESTAPAKSTPGRERYEPAVRLFNTTKGGCQLVSKMNRIRLVASEVFLAVLLLSIHAVSSSMAANPTAGRLAPLISSIPTVQGVMSAPNEDGTAGGLVGSESQAPSANSPITTSVFRGLSYDTTFACGAGLCDFHAAPPDVQVAVSPNYIVEMVNIIYGVWT